MISVPRRKKDCRIHGRPFWVTNESSWCVTMCDPPHGLLPVDMPHHSPFLRQSQQARRDVQSIFWIKMGWGQTNPFLCILVIWLWVTMYSQQWVGICPNRSGECSPCFQASNHQPLTCHSLWAGCCRKRSGSGQLQFQWLLGSQEDSAPPASFRSLPFWRHHYHQPWKECGSLLTTIDS